MGGCCSSSKNKTDNTNVSPSGNENEEQTDSDYISDMAADKQFLATLQEIQLLSSIPEADQRKLAKQLEQKTFKKGEDLMRQGENGTEFFIIAKGKCEVIVANDSGNEVQIAQLVDGDYCGEQALLRDATRGATVRALIETRCLVLNQSAFQQITTENNVRFAKREAKRMAISAEMMEEANNNNQSKTDENKANNNDLNEDGNNNKSKTEETVNWLLKSVDDNILFSHLDSAQRLIVVQQMYKVELKCDDYLITQGEEGNTFYVIESGELVITVKDVGQVDTLTSSRCVGELALLYNAPRAATVQVTSDLGSIVWAVDRGAFRRALMEVHSKQTSENIAFLKKCELLKPLLSSELQLIDQALEVQHFTEGQVIFNLGDDGDRFYIVKSGIVNGIAKDGTEFTLSNGGFFGERALLTSDVRAATITAISAEGVVCLTLSREDFNVLLGPLDDIMKRNLEEYEKPEDVRKPIGHNTGNGAAENICKLMEFKTVGILGRGAFGTVSLVFDPNTNKSYALKAIRKNQVVELGQQAHILNEKKVMQMLDSPFLVALCNTYKDDVRVYFLLEVCLGGELFTILRKMRSFDEPTSRFYAACVIEAFDYMHLRDIIYRDLKPENLVLNDQGYLKVTDFGFAKVVPNKTFTLCGTPDYLAPEIVTGQGHGKGVDWWTLGILLYEMLASFPPFFDDEPMMTYRKIIQGKFKFPRYLSAQSKDLISKLLKPKATKRLGVIKGGADLIRQHPWFKEFNWENLNNGITKAPIRPKVKNPSDLSNFDHFQEKQEDTQYKCNPDLGWDKDF